MKVLRIVLCALGALVGTMANAVEVDSSAGGVSIGTERRVDEKGRTYGYEYWVRNDNSYGVWLLVELVESQNVNDTLLKREVYVAPNSTLYLGTIEQTDPSDAFFWRYRWEARPSYREEVQRQ